MSLDQSHTLLIKHRDCVSHNVQRLEQCVSDIRHHYVELQLSCLGAMRDRRIMAQNVKAHHVEHLRDSGIDFARHDARTGLKSSQFDLVEAGVWSGIQQTKIVCNLGELNRKT